MFRYLFMCLFLVASSGVGQDVAEVANPPLSASVEEQQIRQFFADYETATAADSVQDQIEFFDFDTLTQDVVDQSGVALPPGMQPQLAAAMKDQVAQQFEVLDTPWTRHRVVQIEFSADNTIANVFVRSWSDKLGTSRELYVLKNIDGQWRICDLSELSLGVSTVALSAMGLRDTMQSKIADELANGMREIMQSVTACSQGDLFAAINHIDAVVGFPVPESMQSLRWMISATAHAVSDPTQTIESLDKADAFGGSTILADYLRGEAYLQLGRYDVAVNHFRAYLDQFGADAEAYHSLGYALEQLGRTDEAINAYKAALADTPESNDNLISLALALPKSRIEEFVDFYRNLPHPIDSFKLLGDTFIDSQDAAGLHTLIETTATIDPEAVHIDYYRAMLEHLRGNQRVAFDALANRLEEMDADDESRAWYEHAICEVARRCHRIEPAYTICTDKSSAIGILVDPTDNLGELLPDAASNESVDELLSMHLRDHEHNFETLMLIGHARQQREQYDAARECFVNAMASTEDAEERFEAFEACVDCYVAQDRALDAYDELEPRSDVVNVLEYALDDSAKFEEVVERLRTDEPDSIRFLWEDIDALLENGDYQTGLDRIDRALAVAETLDDDSWRIEYLQHSRTRFLIGLKRYDDAILCAHAAAEEERDFLRALVYAAKGNRSQFHAAYDRCVAAGNASALEEFATAREIPAGWLPDAPPLGIAEPYSPYAQLRRLVVLLDEPCVLDAGRVTAATRAMGTPLYAIDRRQITADEDDYIFEANDHSVIVATQGCRYFIHCGDGPYLHNAELLASQLDVDGELSGMIGRHSAWLAIDIFQWPQDVDQEVARAIPTDASQRLVEFVRQLAGNGATVAIHSDTGVVAKCNDAFFVKLTSDDPISAFSQTSE